MLSMRSFAEPQTARSAVSLGSVLTRTGQQVWARTIPRRTWPRVLPSSQSTSQTTASAARTRTSAKCIQADSREKRSDHQPTASLLDVVRLLTAPVAWLLTDARAPPRSEDGNVQACPNIMMAKTQCSATAPIRYREASLGICVSQCGGRRAPRKRYTLSTQYVANMYIAAKRLRRGSPAEYVSVHTTVVRSCAYLMLRSKCGFVYSSRSSAWCFILEAHQYLLQAVSSMVAT
mmetsp:Transcript_67116/g.189049  ORF Transcript_67116/g.189049 Transcript_67116/m.189049 type:complete len:233 (-) Transcript_67116:1646-2344(-)